METRTILHSNVGLVWKLTAVAIDQRNVEPWHFYDVIFSFVVVVWLEAHSNTGLVRQDFVVEDNKDMSTVIIVVFIFKLSRRKKTNIHLKSCLEYV